MITISDSLDPDWVQGPPATISLSTGVSMDLYGASGSVRNFLPSGTYTGNTCVSAKKANGTNWPYVKCSVYERGAYTDFVDLFVATAAAEETGGYCPVVKGGTTYHVPVSFDRL